MFVTLEWVASLCVVPAHSLFEEHPTRFWTLAPGSALQEADSAVVARVNSLGLRGDEPDFSVNGPRMLLLGDSIVFGVGLPQGATMDRCLESELRVSTGHSWQVFNGGVVAYTSYQGLDLLNEIGPRLRPDVVVVAYRCNDLSQDLVEDHRRLVGGVFPPLRRLLWKTSLYRLIRTQVLGPSPGNQKVEMNRVGARSRVPLEQFRNHLEELGRVSRQFGAAAVVYLALPNRLTEGPEALSCPYRRALLAVGGWDVVCLDLVTPWVKLGLDPEEMFLPGSSDHFTPRGMAVLARIMVDLLRRNPRLAAAVSQREQRVASR